jgi:Zn finger protein HypA/HybF involved in hydrogenase expression
MLFHLYEILSAIFIFQGVALPFLILFAAISSFRQYDRLEGLKKEVEARREKKGKPDGNSQAVLRALRKLKPLNCHKCGAGVLLQTDGILCPNCQTRDALPPDYGEVVALKPRIKRLAKSAMAHWRAAKALIHPVTRWTFFFLIFAEPGVILPALLVGGEVFRYQKTWMDRTLGSMNEMLGGSSDTMSGPLLWLVGAPAFCGIFIWMIVFIFLSSLSKDLNRKLPAAPSLAKSAHGPQTGNCQACGGGLEYDAGDFASICSYCHVENLRVQFVRRERQKGERTEKETKSALFAAMTIIDDFVGTFWVVSVILGIGFVLLLLLNWWRG